jgi:cell division septal protein FtsQ
MGKKIKLRRINTVQLPAHVLNRKKRRKQRVLKAIRFTLVTALFMITIVYASLSPFFNIKQITSEGSSHYDQEVLAAASGIRTGRNGFRLLFGNGTYTGLFRIGDAERNIVKNCSYVRQAKVRYIPPSTIHIETIEREPAAVLDMNGTRLLIDREGYLLEIEPAEVDPGLPVIKTAQLTYADPGSKLEIADEMLLSAFKVFDTIKEVDSANEDKLIDDIDYVDANDPYNICVCVESRIIVNLGKAEDLHYKINAASSIIRKNIKKTERGTLDFSADADPVFTPEYGG